MLSDAGWDPEKKPYPAVDWRTEEAVVVAREQFPRNKDMVFYGLFFEENSIVLDYGWLEPPPEDGATILEDGTEVHTKGSRTPSEPSTIVVSLRPLPVVECLEREFDQELNGRPIALLRDGLDAAPAFGRDTDVSVHRLRHDTLLRQRSFEDGNDWTTNDSSRCCESVGIRNQSNPTLKF